MDDMLVFRPRKARENSKVMRVSNSFEELVTYIKIKTNLPAHVITRMMASYLVDRIAFDADESLFSFKEEA